MASIDRCNRPEILEVILSSSRRVKKGRAGASSPTSVVAPWSCQAEGAVSAQPPTRSSKQASRSRCIPEAPRAPHIRNLVGAGDRRVCERRRALHLSTWSLPVTRRDTGVESTSEHPARRCRRSRRGVGIRCMPRRPGRALLVRVATRIHLSQGRTVRGSGAAPAGCSMPNSCGPQELWIGRHRTCSLVVGCGLQGRVLTKLETAMSLHPSLIATRAESGGVSEWARKVREARRSSRRSVYERAQ